MLLNNSTMLGQVQREILGIKKCMLSDNVTLGKDGKREHDWSPNGCLWYTTQGP